MQIFDESQNPYFNDTLEYYGMLDNPQTIANVSSAMWTEANLKHSINGKMFCYNNWNGGFTIPQGARFAVSRYLFCRRMSSGLLVLLSFLWTPLVLQELRASAKILTFD